MKRSSSRIITICAECKKIRDNSGYWKQMESYIENHSEAKLSHGICPDCAEKLYPEFYVKNEVTETQQSRD